MTTVDVLNDLLIDLRLREKSLEELRVDYCMKNNQKEAARLISKVSGFRLALGLVELRRNDAVRDAAESPPPEAVKEWRVAWDSGLGFPQAEDARDEEDADLIRHNLQRRSRYFNIRIQSRTAPDGQWEDQE